MLLSAVLGVLIGAVLGLTGAGGGILAVPALAFGMGWTMQQAAPVALVAVAIGATAGTLEGLRNGLVRYKAAVLVATSGFPLVYVGQALAQNLPQPWLQTAFSGVMLVVAWRQYWQVRHTPTRSDTLLAKARINPDSGKFIWSVPTALLLAAIGGVTGFMTGLLGVGGGFLIVPLLRKFTEVSVQGIVATSLMVIALVSASGVGSALLRQTTIPWEPALVFAAATVAGMFGGRRLIKKLSQKQVQYGFSAVLTLVAGAMLFGSLRAILL